jgi:chemotaxis protein MotB
MPDQGHHNSGIDDHVEEENYFVSMTDMMVGLVFIFIVLLMYYALQFRDVTDQLTGANQTRTDILETLEKSLKEKGVEVTLDTANGVLRLPDAILFDSGIAELKPEGVVAVQKLGEALGEVLPCYTDNTNNAARPRTCPETPHRIESVYIEGHTDTDALNGTGPIRDNWDLSVTRATNTFRSLRDSAPSLELMCARVLNRCSPILSVSGYGPQRPVSAGDGLADKQRNRRIDLRLVMVAPDSGDAAGAVQKRLEQQ